jgi:uncharacterized damage-inducible protein DinB
MDAVAHFTQLARYNVWATARVLDAVRALPEADYRRDLGLFFKSIHGTLNHLLVGEHHLWFVRFAEGISPKVALDAELESDRAQLDARLREGAARWAPLIASFKPDRWNGHAVLHHHARHPGIAAVCGHAGACVQPRHTPPGPDHCGALTALGQPCPELDLVYFLQNPTKP